MKEDYFTDIAVLNVFYYMLLFVNILDQENKLKKRLTYLNLLFPVSRMHSTVSVLQDGRILLIGGRLSPMRLCTQVVSLRVRLKNSNQSAESTSLCQPCNGHIDEKSTRDTTTENLNLCSNSGTCSLTNNGNNGKEDENSVNINIDCDKKEECVKTEVTCEVVDSMGDIPCPRWRHSAIMCNCKGN